MTCPLGRAAGKTAWRRPWPWWRSACALWQGWLRLGRRNRPVPQLQDHTCAPAGRPAARAAGHLQVRRSSRHPGRGGGYPQARVLKGRVWVALHARRRRQRAHQHPRQQRRLRDAADGARGGGRIMVLARSLDGVISGRTRHWHHQAGVLTDDELRRLPTTSARWTRKAASTRASCYEIRGPRLLDKLPGVKIRLQTLRSCMPI